MKIKNLLLGVSLATIILIVFFAAGAARRILAQTSGTAVCTYTCAAWGDCISNIQMRVCDAKPPGCVPPADKIKMPSLSQPCAASSSAICTSYAYGDWSACISGTQTKSIFSRYPAGCKLPFGILETVSQSCLASDIIAIPCTYAYGLWSVGCSASGYRTRPYAATPAGCSQTTAPYISEPCNAVACSSYAYSDWSACSGSGTQTRTILTKLPAGCAGTGGAVLSQLCANSVFCTSYIYDAWSACSEDGFQTRLVISKSPPGCIDSDNISRAALLKQACAVLPCASYAYSDWGECNADGKQERKIIEKIPAGCSNTKSAVLIQGCVCKSYTYSDWGECDGMGKQSRKVVLAAPAGCSGGVPPELRRDCVAPEEKPCVYSYSAWGACVAGRQTRMVAAKSPAGCDENVAPELVGDCAAAQSALPPVLADAPIPAPESMLVSAPEINAPEVAASANLNGRTGSDWQKYYFGSPDCQSAVVCGGGADPDNDGLNNNDEYRFGANPKSSDTDLDGFIDGYEILNGRNPLIAETSTTTDAVVYESPKEAGRELGETYQVNNIVYDAEKKELTITGKALPDSYVTIYIYSDPIVLTVKTDSDGNWSYVLDKPMEEGSHEVYVAVNDNAGRIIAKSAPLIFAQTAEAATITYPAMAATEDKAPAPTKARLWEGYFIFFGTAIGGLLLALSAIGLGRSIHGAKNDNKQ